MPRITKTTKLLSLLFFSLLTHVSCSPIYLPSRILPHHVEDKKSRNHKDFRKDQLAKEDSENKIISRHYTKPHERNAPNPRKRPYFTRSPSATPSLTSTNAPSWSSTNKPSCQLDDNGEFGTIMTNISTILVPLEYAYEMNVKDDLNDLDIKEMIAKIEMKLGSFVVASLWEECPDILKEVYNDGNDSTNHTFMLRRVEEKRNDIDDNIVDTTTFIDTETLSNQNIIVGLSIEPRDELSESACRDLKIENTISLINCYRVDGEMTIYTRHISPRQTTELTNHVKKVLEDTLANSHFLDNIDEKIESILSTDHDYLRQPLAKAINQVEESTKKTEFNKTWILTSAGAIGVVLIAATIKFKRRHWITKRDSTTDDGSFSLSSYGSWFRKRGGKMDVYSDGNVETQVVV